MSFTQLKLSAVKVTRATSSEPEVGGQFGPACQDSQVWGRHGVIFMVQGLSWGRVLTSGLKSEDPSLKVQTQHPQ